jgi:hypothetical protein
VYNALVIGCGKIGALYDFDTDQIQSHAKAFYLDPRFSLSVYDIDNAISNKIAVKYNCEALNIINEDNIKYFDCVSICAPTEMHFPLLKVATNAGIKVIICEKPVSNKIEELDKAKLIYSGSSKILVNYIRRFQPCFIELKELLSTISSKEALTNIDIRYQRGFINNCSHALDLIEYLTESEINLSDIKKHNLISDHFVNDPTMSLQALWNGINVCIIGLSHVFFSHFEIDLFFEYHKICIRNAGNNIEIHKAEKGRDFLLPLKIQNEFTSSNCLDNYMVSVIERAYQLLIDSSQADNFLQSVNLNKKMLDYLNY